MAADVRYLTSRGHNFSKAYISRALKQALDRGPPPAAARVFYRYNMVYESDAAPGLML